MEEEIQVASQLGRLTPLQIVSYTANAIIFLSWLRSKVLLHRFLVGRWEGSFRKVGEDGVIFHCNLYVASHRDRDDTALFYYQKEDLGNTRICARGVDSLDSYDDDILFFFRRTWRATFVRAVHVSLTSGNEDQVLMGGMPKRYTWECQVKSLLFRPKLSVVIRAVDEDLYTGSLAKH